MILKDGLPKQKYPGNNILPDHKLRKAHLPNLLYVFFGRQNKDSFQYLIR